jgi:hypothetical protein
VSINLPYRITLERQIRDNEIAPVNAGTRDELYR